MGMTHIGELLPVTDGTLAAQVQREGSESQQAVDARVEPVAARLIAEQPPVAAAAAAAAETAVGEELDNSPRIPIIYGDPPHSWADSQRRMNLYDDPTGKVYAPVGIETPYTGVPTPPGVSYLTGTFDPVTRRWSQDTLDEGAMMLDESVFEWLRRAERVPGLFDSWRDQMGLASSAATYRTAAVALTLPGSAGAAPWTSTATAMQARLPVRLPANTRRWRLHLRNYNDRTSQAYAGALSVTGLWFGRHAIGADGSLAGAWATAPTQVQSAFTTAADGGEWVSGWITDAAQQIVAGTEHLLAFGYTCAAQTNHAGLGGGWQSAVPADAGVLAPTTPLTQQQYTPLDAWIEVEVDARIPVVMFVGDSLLVGTGAALPVRDSLANRWASANGAIAQIAAHHGSTLFEWGSVNAWKWQKYAGLTAPDAAYLALGSNDVFNGDPLATIQGRFTAVAGILRNTFTGRLFLSTLLPRNGAATSPDREAVRVAYNDWIGGLPGNAIQAFDIAASVESAPGVVDARYITADLVHLNRAGYARNARAITAPLAVRR